jgi:uncharacterized delta-60 repeat protein
MLGQVNTLLLDSNNKLYVGGNFDTYKSNLAPRLVKLNADGSRNRDIDAFLNLGFNGTVTSFLSTSDNKLYVGGNFTEYNGVLRNRLIRLTRLGELDTSFDIGTGFNGQVNTLQLDSNGKLYVGGSFTTYKGATESRIIRLNPDGSKDTDFDNSTGFGAQVRTLQLDNNGKLYVGGDFNSYKGVAANRIIRLNSDGSKDTDFDNSPVIWRSRASLHAFQLDNNGKLYAGGQLYYVQRSSCKSYHTS